MLLKIPKKFSRVARVFDIDLSKCCEQNLITERVNRELASLVPFSKNVLKIVKVLGKIPKKSEVGLKH